RLIDNLEEERKRKLSELRDKFSLRVNISLVNAVVLCMPTIGVIAPKKKRPAAKNINLAALGSSAGFATRSAIQ
ncbi:MAG: hypothetical protein ACD_39C00066G0002, partial [uncultured bacterium]